LEGITQSIAVMVEAINRLFNINAILILLPRVILKLGNNSFAGWMDYNLILHQLLNAVNDTIWAFGSPLDFYNAAPLNFFNGFLFTTIGNDNRFSEAQRFYYFN
jgi:hypothetical protein